MPSIAAVIPHFWSVRRQNILTLVRELNNGTVPPEQIIIWNNDHPFDILPQGVSVIQSPFNIGCKARFLAAMCTSADYVLFQDNDLAVQPETLNHLLSYAQIFAGDIIALEGRKLRKGLTYDQCEFVDGRKLQEATSVNISIGRCELVSRKVVNKLLSSIPFEESTVMDDIWFSYAAAQHGVSRWCVPYTPGLNGFTNLHEGQVGAFRHPEHMKKRDELCQKFFPLHRL